MIFKAILLLISTFLIFQQGTVKTDNQSSAFEPAAAGEDSNRLQYAPMRTNLEESDIDRLEKELIDPITRLSAIAALSDFGGWKLYHVGSVFTIDPNAKRDALRERAAKLAQLYTDIETVSSALDSTDPKLQLWGIWFWNAGIFKAIGSAGRFPSALPMDGLTDEEKSWHGLMPKIRRLAQDSIHRTAAIRKLSSVSNSENREFLLNLIPMEKSAGVMLQLLDCTAGGKSKRDERFNEELMRLLADPDFKVRSEALASIATNCNSAEVFQVRFSATVSQRVEELRNSDDMEEKRLANWAAEGLEKIARIWLDRDGVETR